MTTYSVRWKDFEGNAHKQAFEADSPSAALAAAIDKIDLLRLHPNLVERVLLELP